MSKTLDWRALAATGLLFGLTAPAAAAPITIGGQALDDAGRPLAGATVELRRPADYLAAVMVSEPPEPLVAVSSNADGGFTLELPRVGWWSVVVRHDGYLARKFSLPPIVAPRVLPPVRLRASSSLEVLVKTPAGEPLAAALVAWRSPRPAAGEPDNWGEEVVPVPTAEGGRVGLEVPRAGDVEVFATHPDFVVATGTVDRAAGELELRLKTGRPVLVEVSDDAGRAVPEAAVLAAYAELGFATTDDQGRARLTLPPDRAVQLLAGTRDGATAQLDIPLSPGKRGEEPAVLELRLEPLLRLRGRVLEAGSHLPLAGVFVWSYGGFGRGVETASDGSFELPSSTRHHIAAAAPGYVGEGERRLWEPIDPQGEVVIQLRPAGTLEGVVVDEAGSPIAGAALSSRDLSDIDRWSDLDLRVATGLDGRFELAPIPLAEPFTLLVRHPDFADTVLKLAGPSARTPWLELEIVLGAGYELGGVVEDEGGGPIGGASVQLRSTATTRHDERRELLALSDGTGRFSFTRLPGGVYALVAEAAGYAQAQRRGIEVGAAGELAPVVLAPEARIEGRVEDHSGRPISGATIGVGREAAFLRGGHNGSPSFTSGSDGTFVVGGLNDGERVQLSVFAPGSSRAESVAARAPSSEPLVVVLSAKARVSGVILDESGQPVPGAVPSAVVRRRSATGSGSSSSSSGAVGADGRFSLDVDVGTGTSYVVATAEGYEPAELELELAPGQELDGVHLLLRAASFLSGRVLDADGAPLPAARVQHRSTPKWLATGSHIASVATTDVEGRYRLQVSPGTTTVRAEADGYPPVHREVEVKREMTELDFRLERGLELSGRVVDEHGTPIGGAELRPRAATLPTQPTTSAQSHSAADGSFAITGLAPGEYQLWVSAAGLAPRVLQKIELRESRIDVGDIVLHRGGAIVGRLRGASVRDLTLVDITASGGGFYWARGDVSAEGSFRIADLAPARYTVSAMLRPTGRQATATVELPPGVAEVTLDLDLGGGLTLSGVVRHAGTPVAGAGVVARQASRDRQRLEVVTTHDGRFRIDGLASGATQLQVHAFSHRHFFTVDLDLYEDREVAVDLRIATIVGRVVDAGTGAVVAAARLQLAPASERTFWRGLDSGESDASGSFVLADLPAGSYRLRVHRAGYQPEVRVVELDEEETEQLEIALLPAARLELYVHDASGRPVSWASVLVRSEGREISGDSYSAGEGGRVVLDSVPVGSSELFVTAAGSATARLVATAPGPPIKVVLPLSGDFELSVPALAGSRAAIELRSPAGETYLALTRSLELGWRYHLREGRVLLADVPAGRWTVVALSGGEEEKLGEVVVLPGGTTAVNF